MVWILIIVVIVLVVTFMNKESNKMDDAERYFNLGIQHSEHGDFDGAIEEYTKLLALYPDYYAAYNNRGMVKMQMGNLDGALKDFEASIRVEPDRSKNIKAYNNKIIVEEKISRKKTPIRKQTDINNRGDFLQKGTRLYNEGNYVDAIIQYKNASKIKLDVDVLCKIAGCYNKLGDSEKTLQYANQAVGLDDNNVGALSVRALQYYQMEKFELAEKDLVKIVRLDPQNSHVVKPLLEEVRGEIQRKKEDAKIEIFVAEYPELQEALLYQKLTGDRSRVMNFLARNPQASIRFAQILGEDSSSSSHKENDDYDFEEDDDDDFLPF